MKRLDSKLFQDIPTDDYEYIQASKEEAIKERQQDIWSDGILRDGISQFYLSTNSLTNYYLDIGFGTGWIDGERVQIWEEEYYYLTNPTRKIRGVSAPKSSGNIGVHLANYTPGVWNYVWLSYLEVADEDSFLLDQELGGEYCVRTKDGYELIVDTSHDPAVNPLQNSLYLGKIEAQGSAQPLNLPDYTDRKYCQLCLPDAITVLNYEGLSWSITVFNDQVQQQDANQIKSSIFNLLNWNNVHDRDNQFTGVDGATLSRFSDKIVTEVFIDKGGARGTIDPDSSTAVWRAMGDNKKYYSQRLGNSCGFYYPGSFPSYIQTRRIFEGSCSRFMVSVLSNDESINKQNTYDISFDDGSTWLEDLVVDEIYSVNPVNANLKVRINVGSGEESPPVWTTKATLGTGRYSLTGFALEGYVFAVGGISTPTVERYDPGSDLWSYRSPLSVPTYRYYCSGFSLDNYGYISGGVQQGTLVPYVPTSFTKETLQYDNVSDSWVNKANMNYPLYGGGYFVIGEYAYVSAKNTPSTTVTERYDKGADIWTLKSPRLYTDRSFLGSFASEECGYVCGGINGAINPVSIVESYDPTTDSWTYKQSLIMSMGHVSGFGFDDYGYIVGGRDVGGYSSKIAQRYDILSNIWSLIPSLTLPAEGAVGIHSGEYGYVVGGTGSVETLTANQRFNPEGLNTPSEAYWLQKAPMSHVRYQPTGFILGGYGYVVAGDNSDYQPSSVVERYDDYADAWTGRTGLSVSRDSPAGFSLNGYGYIAAGDNNSSVLTSTERYDEEANIWAMKASCAGRSESASFTLQGYGYMIGGFSSILTYTRSNAVYRYSDLDNSWTTVGSLNTARAQAAGFSLNGYGYVTSGSVSGGGISSTFEKYDPGANSWTIGAIGGDILHSCFALNGFGYKVLGTNAGGNIQKYDDLSGIWTISTPVGIIELEGAASFAYHGYGYACGGREVSSKDYSNKVQQYHPCDVQIYGYGVKCYE